MEISTKTSTKTEKKGRLSTKHIDQDHLESKKGKIKQKRKSRTKLYLKEEDTINELKSSHLKSQISTSLASSLARPERPPKQEGNRSLDLNTNTTFTKKKKIKKHLNHKKSILASAESNKIPETIKLSSSITIQELADISNIPQEEIIKYLFLQGMIININQIIDYKTAISVAGHFGITIKNDPDDNISTIVENTIRENLKDEEIEDLELRPPIVTIMGHVDHGKTTLLDNIRHSKTKIADQEFGGITQTIGTYEIEVSYKSKPFKITFLDTPGHKAFVAMRERGVKLADIAVLVIAADDGIKPQTEEAIEYIQKAGLSLIIAVNKIDKEGADVEKIKEYLTKYNIIAEDWGGDTQIIPISAKTGKNIDKLLESISLIAEISNFQANPNKKAQGTIIESHLDKTKGAVATLIIQNGSLTVGDILYSDNIFGKIRAMTNSWQEKIEKCGPSSIVEVCGISDIASIGSQFEICTSEKEARSKAEDFIASQKSIGRNTKKSSNTKLEYGIDTTNKCLRIILKTSTQGTLESILDCINNIPQTKIQIEILTAASGEITETDIHLANSTQAQVIGFDTSYAPGAKQAAEKSQIVVQEYKVIYDVIENLEKEMISLLDPFYIEEEIGKSEIKTIFNLSKGVIAGCYINEGKLKRNCLVKIFRQHQEIYKGNLDSIKKIKEDVAELEQGQECGIFIEDFQDWQKDDQLIAFNLIEQNQNL
nr:InfB [Madagascaria erythrocladioides]